MDSDGASRKRWRSDANGGPSIGEGAAFKRVKETYSSQPGLGGKTKPCTKFFSPTGCQYGDTCHFQHYVPGGFNANALMPHTGNSFLPPPRNPMPSRGGPEAPSPAVKTLMCNKFNTAEGCRFGDKCHYAHGEREMGKPVSASYRESPAPGPTRGRFAGRFEPPPSAAAAIAASFGANATAKISVDGSLAGAIIGKGGANTKHIYHVTGAKLYIRDHETDNSQKNIELEGSFDQIKDASTMVKDLIMSISTSIPIQGNTTSRVFTGGPGNNFKKKLCDKFDKGSCTFGDRCNFAHGQSELRV